MVELRRRYLLRNEVEVPLYFETGALVGGRRQEGDLSRVWLVNLSQLYSL